MASRIGCKTIVSFTTSSNLSLIHILEDNGGVVVAIENCSGVRTLGSPVEEDCEDIYEAIARKYLSTGCSIMTPNDNRIDLIGEIIEEYLSLIHIFILYKYSSIAQW